MSAAAALDALSSALVLNPGGETSVTRDEDSYVLSLPPSAFFPGEPPHKDVEEAMEAALEGGKLASKKQAPPPFKVRLAYMGQDPAFSSFLWAKDKEARIPYGLREPDPKLFAATNLARSNLSTRLLCMALTGALRDILHALTKQVESMPQVDLQ